MGSPPTGSMTCGTGAAAAAEASATATASGAVTLGSAGATAVSGWVTRAGVATEAASTTGSGFSSVGVLTASERVTRVSGGPSVSEKGTNDDEPFLSFFSFSPKKDLTLRVACGHPYQHLLSATREKRAGSRRSRDALLKHARAPGLLVLDGRGVLLVLVGGERASRGSLGLGGRGLLDGRRGRDFSRGGGLGVCDQEGIRPASVSARVDMHASSERARRTRLGLGGGSLLDRVGDLLRGRRRVRLRWR